SLSLFCLSPLSSLLRYLESTSGFTPREELIHRLQPPISYATRALRTIRRSCLRRPIDSRGSPIGQRQSLSTFAPRPYSARRATRGTKYTPAWEGFVPNRRRCLGPKFPTSSDNSSTCRLSRPTRRCGYGVLRRRDTRTSRSIRFPPSARGRRRKQLLIA